MTCDYDEWGTCAKDRKPCEYRRRECPKLKAEQRGMKQLREETRKP